MFILFSVCYIQAIRVSPYCNVSQHWTAFVHYAGEGRIISVMMTFCQLRLVPLGICGKTWKTIVLYSSIYFVLYISTCVYVLDIHTHCIYSFNVPCFVMRVRKGSWRLLCCKASTPWIFMGLCHHKIWIFTIQSVT